MFNISFSELIVILLIAFLVVGPKDLPKIAKACARGVKKARQFLYDVKASVDPGDDLQTVRDEVTQVTQAVRDVDPTARLRETAQLSPVNEMRELKQEINKLTATR